MQPLASPCTTGTPSRLVPLLALTRCDGVRCKHWGRWPCGVEAGGPPSPHGHTWGAGAGGKAHAPRPHLHRTGTPGVPSRLPTIWPGAGAGATRQALALKVLATVARLHTWCARMVAGWPPELVLQSLAIPMHGHTRCAGLGLASMHHGHTFTAWARLVCCPGCPRSGTALVLVARLVRSPGAGVGCTGPMPTPPPRARQAVAWWPTVCPALAKIAPQFAQFADFAEGENSQKTQCQSHSSQSSHSSHG